MYYVGVCVGSTCHVHCTTYTYTYIVCITYYGPTLLSPYYGRAALRILTFDLESGL